MLRYVTIKLSYAMVTLFAVMLLVFMLARVIPGDPAQLMLGDQASQSAIDSLRERLGLDQPLYLQFLDFLTGLAQGDWGTSLYTREPVLNSILEVLPYTLELTAASLLFGAVVGIPFGIWAALHRNRFIDYATRIGSLLGLSFPAFVSGIMLLLVFGIWLGWFPVLSTARGGSFEDRLLSLALPTVNLGILMAAYIARMTRSSMLAVLGEDYVQTARAKGVARHLIIRRHALRNAIIPVVTVIGLYVGILIGNSVLTEIVFNRPGIGKLIVGSMNQRDYPMLQGLMVLYTLLVILVNLATDLVYGLLDPRVKYQ
ncbi:ABC transporter permease [Fodinicurvata fenggangensis]|uniref:ABC transporter permease n=1 Tax=Fodinicurvata fenggangensis TaxID=1121830 RepID=UPI000479F108|nr:ABC transporter permease [Fodinicurvata fenggangensis]